MPNDMATAGNKAPQVEFLSSALPALWMCRTVFAWITPSLMDRRVCSQVIAFGGAYHFTDLYSVLCTSLTRDSCNTKVLFNHFDCDSWIVVGCTLDFDDCSTLKCWAGQLCGSKIGSHASGTVRLSRSILQTSTVQRPTCWTPLNKLPPRRDSANQHTGKSIWMEPCESWKRPWIGPALSWLWVLK